MSNNIETSTYYALPVQLTEALQARTRIPVLKAGSPFGEGFREGPDVYTHEEREDLIDGFHFWRTAIDVIKAAPEALSMVSILSINTASVRFRKSHAARSKATADMLHDRGICMRSKDSVVFTEDVLPSDLWAADSPTRELYKLSFEEAQHRFIKKLLGKERDLPALPTEPAPALPQALLVTNDFFGTFNGQFIKLVEGETVTDPLLIREIVKHMAARAGYPVVALGATEPVNLCPKCYARGKVGEDDGKTYLKVTGSLKIWAKDAFFIKNKGDIIDDPVWVDYFQNTPDLQNQPLEVIKRSDFIRCENILDGPYGKGKCYTSFFPKPIPTPIGLAYPATSGAARRNLKPILPEPGYIKEHDISKLAQA